MSTTVAGTEVRRYLDAVREHLDYLPMEDRDELLEDLEEHLREVAAENDGTLEQRLGPAPAYAEELRASAGLPERGADATTGLIERLSRSRPMRKAVAAFDSARAHEARRFARDLAPGWWVFRGYLAVLTWGVFATRDQGLSVRETIPVPLLMGSYAWGILASIAAILLSVKLGRMAARDRRAWILSVAATVVVLAVGLTVLGDLGSGRYAYAVSDDGSSSESTSLHHDDGTTIANICPYSADGMLLSSLLLFDQFGRPIINSSNDIEGRQVEQAKPAILNVYPKAISYVDYRGESFDPVTGESTAQKTLTPLLCPPTVTGPSTPVSPGPAATEGP